ncbi:Hsp20 family protein [Staphylococcus sp. NRL 18/288]|nr:Hsp20 family protein [Staphylococcus sp. NRL 18/288]MCJ1661495.1 Hsp20 family protein [Staphylococcus sp. NRL 18/288]
MSASGELIRRFDFEDIDESQIKASYNDGILVVILPKETLDEDNTTKIEID